MSTKICKDCGSAGEPGSLTNGSIVIEIILWLCLLIPGLIYTIWRRSTDHDVCRSCGSTAIIPMDTPVGRQLVKEHNYIAPIRTGGTNVGLTLGRAFRKVFLRK